MNWIKRLISRVADYFRSGKAERDALWALSLIEEALPIVEFVATFTPTPIDDAVIAALRSRFPELFDGKQMTPDEWREFLRKLLLLAIAGELLKRKHPSVDTSVARTAVQLAYLEYRSR